MKNPENAANDSSVEEDWTDRRLSLKHATMFLERITDVAYTADMDGNITWVNKAVKTVAGLDPEEVIGKPFIPLFTKRDHQSLREVYERTLNGEYLENTATLVNGRTCHISSLPMKDADGNIIATFGLARDITERIMQEKEYSHILKASIDGIWILDNELRVVEVNHAATEMLGYTKAEMMNLHVYDIDARFNPDEIRRQAEEVQSDGGLRFETEHRRKDGSIVDVEVSVSYIPTGGVYAVAFLRDISKAKRANEALRDAKIRFQQAFDTSPDAIVISRLSDGTYVEANQGFLDSMYFSREEVIGKTSIDLNIWVDLTDREALVEDLRRDGKCRNLEVMFRRKDGSVSPGLVSASVIRFEGEPHIITVTRDISNLKKAEQERARLREQLQQAQKMDALGTLSSGIAHDFNNILSAIMGYAELSLDDLPDVTLVRENLHEITSAAKRARKLVRQILTFSRVIEGEERLLSLSRVVRDAMVILNHTLPKMIDLKLDLAHDIYPIMADQQQIEQVVINLVTNAADATEGDGRILVSTRNVESTPTQPDTQKEPRFDTRCRSCGCELPGRHVVLSVKDDGIGISPDVLAKIWEPFFTTKAVGKGTGLGLSTVYGIINNLHGHICCESEEGYGTEFVVYLPATAGTVVEPSSVHDNVAVYTHEGASILVVDDEIAVRTIAQKLLAREGYIVHAVASGEEAIAFIEREEIEIDGVLLDLSMPGMGGAACLKEIRKTRPDLQVLIASGYIQDELNDELADLGASGMIAKPYSGSELSKKVAELLASHRDEQA